MKGPSAGVLSHIPGLAGVEGGSKGQAPRIHTVGENSFFIRKSGTLGKGISGDSQTDVKPD